MNKELAAAITAPLGYSSDDTLEKDLDSAIRLYDGYMSNVNAADIWKALDESSNHQERAEKAFKSADAEAYMEALQEAVSGHMWELACTKYKLNYRLVAPPTSRRKPNTT